MAKEDPSYYAMTLRRGETKSVPFVYRPRNPELDPYDLSGQPVELRIKPKGEDEIVKSSAPHIAVTDGPGGEITIAYPGAEVTAFEFQNAKYAVLLNGERLFYGDLTIKDLYE